MMGFGFAAVPALVSFRWFATKGSGKVNSFYVAGARFNATNVVPSVGDPLIIKRQTWNGERCYEVCTERGHRLGFVPRGLVAIFDDLVDRNWQLLVVDPYAVPWKRYKVGLAN
jgi:hypothetical protein